MPIEVRRTSQLEDGEIALLIDDGDRVVYLVHEDHISALAAEAIGRLGSEIERRNYVRRRAIV